MKMSFRSNSTDASKLGIKNGDMVKVTSVTGSYMIKAKLWEGIRPAPLPNATVRDTGHTAKWGQRVRQNSEGRKQQRDNAL